MLLLFTRGCPYTKVYRVSIYIYAAYPQRANTVIELAVRVKGIDAGKLACELLVDLCTKQEEKELL